MDAADVQAALSDLADKIEVHAERDTAESTACLMAVSFIRTYAVEFEAWHHTPEPPPKETT